MILFLKPLPRKVNFMMHLVFKDFTFSDPFSRKPTAVQWRYTEEGERVRVSTRTGRIIPLSRDARYADPEDGINTLDFKGKYFSLSMCVFHYSFYC